MSENTNLDDIKRINRLEAAADPQPAEPEIPEDDETGIETELRKDIEAVLNVCVRPKLANDGGDLELVALDEDGTLWIRMLGECAGCPSADETAKGLVQSELCKRIPQIKCVEIDDGIDMDFLKEALDTLMSNRG